MVAYVRLIGEKSCGGPPAESKDQSSPIRANKGKKIQRKCRKCHARDGSCNGSHDSSRVPQLSSKGGEREMPRGRRAGSSGDSRGRSPSRSRRGAAAEFRRALSEGRGTSPKRNTPAISP